MILRCNIHGIELDEHEDKSLSCLLCWQNSKVVKKLDKKIALLEKWKKTELGIDELGNIVLRTLNQIKAGKN